MNCSTDILICSEASETFITCKGIAGFSLKETVKSSLRFKESSVISLFRVYPGAIPQASHRQYVFAFLKTDDYKLNYSNRLQSKDVARED